VIPVRGGDSVPERTRDGPIPAVPSPGKKERKDKECPLAN
jgi:hypothetical protein